MPELYFRFLNLMKAIDDPILNDRNNGALQLLQHICNGAFLDNRTFTVNEVIGWKELGSQASLHKRLHELVDQDMLLLTRHDTDARIKLVTPTSKAKKLFSQLDKLLKKTTQSAK